MRALRSHVGKRIRASARIRPLSSRLRRSRLDRGALPYDVSVAMRSAQRADLRDVCAYASRMAPDHGARAAADLARAAAIAATGIAPRFYWDRRRRPDDAPSWARPTLVKGSPSALRGMFGSDAADTAAAYATAAARVSRLMASQRAALQRSIDAAAAAAAVSSALRAGAAVDFETVGKARLLELRAAEAAAAALLVDGFFPDDSPAPSHIDGKRWRDARRKMRQAPEQAQRIARRLARKRA